MRKIRFIGEIILVAVCLAFGCATGHVALHVSGADAGCASCP